MNASIHNVEALSPEAFTSLARSPFPCAPGYGREFLSLSDPLKPQTVRYGCARMLDVTLLQREFLDSSTLVLLPKGAVYFGTHETRFSCQKCYEYDSIEA